MTVQSHTESETAPSTEASEAAPSTTPETPLPAEEPLPAPREHFLSLDSRTMTGDWFGVRTKLEDHGVRANVFFNYVYGAVLKGGTNTSGCGEHSGSMDAIITFDLGKLGLIPEADMLVHVQMMWGDGVNNRTGALAQVNDDADDRTGAYIDQLWYRQHFLDRRVSLQFGFLDFQTILDRNAYANSEDKQFMHQTLDNNPLVPLNIGLGVSLTVQPCDWYTLILGAGDAQSVLYKPGFSTTFHDEDWFIAYMEHGFHVKLPSDRGPLAGNYRVGMLYDPRPRPWYVRSEFDAPTRRSGYGLYVSLDQMLYRENKDDDQGLGVFARYAYQKPENHRIQTFWSGGFQYKGLIPERDEDVLGAAFSLQHSSHAGRKRADADFGNETVYELYYAIQVTNWLAITPDIQYVDNPGASDDHGHAIIASLRFRVSL